jgi:hypothetical protein
LFGKHGFDVRPESFERSPVATDKLTVTTLVSEAYRKLLDDGEIDEGSVLSMNVAGEGTSLVEPFRASSSDISVPSLVLSSTARSAFPLH